MIATGQLHRPALPRIDGIESFEGHAFHSAEWDHDLDLAGKRVAVIGTGASAVQFVPEIAKTVGHLDVFQRSGNWFMPRRNRFYPGPVALAIRRIPGVQAFRRRFMFNYGESLTAMIRHPRTLGRLGKLRSTLFMRWQLRDPELRRKAWPDYTFGCKRILFSSWWLPTLQRPNVELHTDAITGIEPKGVRTSDGVLHEADVIIWGTGFKTTDFMLPMEVHGSGGRSLTEAWADGPHAHLGVTVPGFPSMFLMYGPNTNTSGGSIIVYLEAQAAYIRKALQLVRDAGAEAIEVSAEAEAEADAAVQARFQGTAWTECDSWYRNESGRVVTNWPGYMREYVAATEVVDPALHELIGAGSRRTATSQPRRRTGPSAAPPERGRNRARSGGLAGLMPSLALIPVRSGRTAAGRRRGATLVALAALACLLALPSPAPAAAGRASAQHRRDRHRRSDARADERRGDAARRARCSPAAPSSATRSPSLPPAARRARPSSAASTRTTTASSPTTPATPGLTNKSNVLPVWMQQAGYRTAHFGKFLNHFGSVDGYTTTPPGLGPLVHVDRLPLLRLPGRQRRRHQALRRAPPRLHHPPDHDRGDQVHPHARRAPQPVYVQIDHFAPHAEQASTPGRCTDAAQPDPDDASLYLDEPLPQSGLDPATRSFNEQDLSDKSPAIAARPLLGDYVIGKITRRYRCQLAALAGVDRSVAEVETALKDAGALRRTAIFFTSDNGFFHGEHRLPNNKGLPYEEGIRVPLLARLPKSMAAAQPAEVDEPVANIDLAPTLLDLAGGATPCNSTGRCRRLDGRSLLGLLQGDDSAWPEDRRLLVEQGRIQYFCAPYTAIWGPTEMLAQFPTGDGEGNCGIETEHYDMGQDPMQLQNLFPAEPSTPLYAREQNLTDRLEGMKSCSGIAGREEPLPGHPLLRLSAAPGRRRRRRRTGAPDPAAG